MKITELYNDVINENLDYEYKAELNPEKPMNWAKTIVGYANGKGGVMFVGVSNDGEAFGLNIEEIDRTKNLVARINDRNIFPHARVQYSMRSVDDNAEHFVLGVHVLQADSILRYREGDYNEKVFTKGDGYALPATPEEIIALAKRKYGVDNETTDIIYDEANWTEYIDLCKEYRDDPQPPTLKELQNEEIVSKDGYVKSGLLMFKDGYDGEDTLICCRLWRGKKKTGAVLDSDRFRGSLANVFKNTIKFIERNTKTVLESYVMKNSIIIYDSIKKGNDETEFIDTDDFITDLCSFCTLEKQGNFLYAKYANGKTKYYTSKPQIGFTTENTLKLYASYRLYVPIYFDGIYMRTVIIKTTVKINLDERI